jgi:hypothetical protein
VLSPPFGHHVTGKTILRVPSLDICVTLCCSSGPVCHACNSSVGVNGDWVPEALESFFFFLISLQNMFCSRLSIFFTVTPFREMRWIMYRVAVNATPFCLRKKYNSL